jgi:adenylate cyclase
MARVFLSYARSDIDAAKQLAELLSRAGHEVWWDRHLHAGSRFAIEIEQALKDAEAIVVLWSEHSVKSAWVQDEASEGRDSGRLVPVIVGSVKPPLGFRQFHTIELGTTAESRPEVIDELLNAVSRMSGAGQGDLNEVAFAAVGD